MVREYIKKPRVIQAIQLDYEGSNIRDVVEFVVSGSGLMNYSPETGKHRIETLEGDMFIDYGDYVIRGVQGEFYPCKPDIFMESYDPVD